MDNFDLTKFLAEGKLNENMFDVDATTKIAQAVADAFTADDELDLKYVINPRIDAGHFDLDVEAGPNTPGEDWKDAGGFSIDNYLGDFAGGSFYIKDGVVYNAASRNAPVANVSPEGEVEMISAEDSRAAIGMEENKKEIKSNKMKKSELKEMIKAAMMAETTGAAIEAEEYDPVAEAEKTVEEGTWSVLPDRIPEFIKAVEQLKDEYHGVVGSDDVFDGLDAAISAAEELLMNTAEVGDMPGFEGTRDALNSLSIREEEEEDIEVDAEEVDAKIDTPEGEAEIETTDVTMAAEVDPNVKATQDALSQAMEAAKALGDKKLADQIGNTITFFTRQHVAGTETGTMAEADEMEEGKKEYYKDAEADDAEHIKALEKDMADDKKDSMKIGEVLFPMWTKLQK